MTDVLQEIYIFRTSGKEEHRWSFFVEPKVCWEFIQLIFIRYEKQDKKNKKINHGYKPGT